MKALEILKENLGIKKKRIYKVEDSIHLKLREIAEKENRRVDDLAAEILEEGVNRRLESQSLEKIWKSLSIRERQVVGFTCLNYTNNRIADKLNLSPATIKNHLQTALKKYNVNSKPELQKIMSWWNFEDWEEPNL